MSGYRSIHREKLGSFPIWQVRCTPIFRKGGTAIAATAATGNSTTSSPTTITSWRVWLACGDGIVRGYVVNEKTLEMQRDILDASACTCIWTHALVGKALGRTEYTEQQQQLQQVQPSPSPPSRPGAIGCSQLQLVRNYVGDDDNAGDILVISLDLVGTVRLWVFPEDMDQDLHKGDNKNENDNTLPVNTHLPTVEFRVEDATGTSLQIFPPKVAGVGDVLVAVPCLDGTIALVATGVVTPKSDRNPTPAGTVMERWSKDGTIALCTSWHPTKKAMAVGRQDGLVEILGDRSHRLIQHETPVRVIEFTPDGNLLLTGSDDGMLCVWDISRVIPTLVHHVVQAHGSWILSLTTLNDSRRFVSGGADRRLHVWNAGQMDQPVHSFTSDDEVWTIHAQVGRTRPSSNAAKVPPRLISGSDNGGLQIYSFEV